MKYLSVLLITIVLSFPHYILGQNCLDSKMKNIEFINHEKEDLKTKFDEDKIFINKLFEEKKLCKNLDNISFIYTSHFFMSGYSSETSSISKSFYFFSKDYKLIYWYSGNTRSLSNKLKMSLDIQNNDEIESSKLEYIQSVLKQINTNDIQSIEKEQSEKKGGIISVCDCSSDESIYYITPNITKVYFFDLYYKRLHNSDSYKNFIKEIEEYYKQLIE